MNKSPEFGVGYDPDEQGKSDILKAAAASLPDIKINSNAELRALFFGEQKETTRSDHGDLVERKPYADVEVMRELEKRRDTIQELEDKVKFLETHDALTLLYNRKGLKQLVREYQKKGVDGTLLFLDLDNFKQINTRYGELIGDMAIQQSVIGMAKHFRIGQDIMCRWGGEEFVLFLLGAAPGDIEKKLGDENGIPRINILAKLHTEKLDGPAGDVPQELFTFSGGIVALNHDDNLEAAIKRANEIMTEVKASGKNEIRAEQVPEQYMGKTA